ncbi:type VI secretion system Vgr family protein [Montanilutibacter psychrotolerans]|uniref:Type VI secretion system tip protein VgrG n=1 Tax=Montanilutibacter psychrotolerans TaxID=1327343 RepID=A0A3M8SU54_9GAMM|nr:type VI secretion system Vgr family protein [Lysobacter psychrotolerans]RNF82390.1 type VI secretion system tip protein VgrG [Lysobacter psychrotolerans]
MDVLATVLTAMVGGPVQNERLLRLHTPLGPEVLVAETLDGVESLSPGAHAEAGFRLELTALSVDAHIDLTQLLGQPVLLELLTDASRTQLRPFHAHVTRFERLGSNGGLARYRLVLEPWLAFARQRIDSYVFQDMTVVEIVESVFADYADAGKLAPAWRWELADQSVYRKRSLTTQYQESDLAFVERVLAEEGIGYWFEHRGDTGGESLGTHTLVLADHNDAFVDAGAVRFHRSDATERSDSIQHWSSTRRWQTTRLQRASWDYRSRGLRPSEAEGTQHGGVAIADVDTAGPYAWPDAATGARYARQQLEALQVAADSVHGGGSWRVLAPGARFVLRQHPNHEGAAFHCLRVQHRARNNLGAEVFEQVEAQLGLVALPTLPLGEVFGGAAPADEGLSDTAIHLDTATATDFYRNAFDALPAAVPYRPQTVDGHGLRRHPKPTVHGTQTAIVVSDGTPLQTDRDHRLKVQFAWQRGGDASNRQSHPAGDDNAPGNDAAWTWVRVATPWAGDNWGGVLLPRKGQEVLVAFLEGDIDRPVVIGAVYNGRGQTDAAHNRVAGGAAGATGNAAAWFDGNAHAPVFTGFKSQALADSQGGSGGYQQLRLDDTPGQGRAQATTTQHDSELNLGHLKGGEDNLRGAERGFGAELATRASGALRAGAGLLISTEPGREQMAASGAQSQLGKSTQLVQSLAGAASAQTAGLPDDSGDLPVQTTLATTAETLKATQSGSAPGDGIGGGDGEVPGWSSSAIVASSPAGLVSVTPADQVWVSGTQTLLAADGDLQWLSQGETVHAAAGGIVLFTQGGEAPAGKPNQERGIALHAAQGAVSARAHKEIARVAAQLNVTLSSTEADVSIAAPSKHVLVTAAGAYLKLEGGNIELGAPGTIEFKASKKEWTGPKSASAAKVELPSASYKGCDFKMQNAAQGGAGLV